jgi:diketogulonate reductase-like aldo/keto reductase
MPIPGTTSIAHVQENLGAQDLEPTPEGLRSITNLAAADQ